MTQQCSEVTNKGSVVLVLYCDCSISYPLMCDFAVSAAVFYAEYMFRLCNESSY